MKKRKPAPATGTKGPRGLPSARLKPLPPGTVLKGESNVPRGTKGPKGLPAAKLPPLPPGTILKGDEIVDRTIMPVPNYDEAMAMQTYKNLMDYQRGVSAAQNAANIQNQFQNYASGVNNLMPNQPPMATGAMRPLAGQPVSPRQNSVNINQAMQEYQNLLNQGTAIYQAAMQRPIGQPMQPAQSPRKNISTSRRTPPIQAF
jgi:hypothetical protein